MIPVFLIIFPFLMDIPSLLLVYAIVKKSPKKMEFIRPFLLKMVVSQIFDEILKYRISSNRRPSLSLSRREIPFPLV